MPKKKRGSDFSHIKTGKHHDKRGGGGGRRGKPSGRNNAKNSIGDQASTFSDFGHNPGTPESLISNADSENSNTSSAFMDALRPVDVPIPTSEVQETREQVTCAYAENDMEPDLATVYLESFNLFRLLLPNYWKVIQVREGFHVVCISRGSENIAVQREVFASFSGDVKVFVHGKQISEEFYQKALDDSPNILPLNGGTIKNFVVKILRILLLVRSYEICAGADHSELESLCKSESGGFVDYKPHFETRYVRTFRSHERSLLVSLRSWTCKKVIRRLKDKFKNHQEEQVLDINTRNSYLGENQMQTNLKEQRRELKNARRKTDYLNNKVAHLITRDGVNLDSDVSQDLIDILRDSKLTPVQQLFIQQQVKYSTLKGATGMRWHPTMIRFALLIKSTSSAAYAAIAGSGVIRLPPERTLFDFEHAIPRSEEVFTEKLAEIGKKVKGLKHVHQQFHNLLMDEIHISQKLVYRKSDGNLIGYVKLNEVGAEFSR